MTIRAKIYPSHARKDGTCQIKLVIRQGDTRSIRGLSLHVHPSHFNNESGYVKDSHPLHKEYNAKIDHETLLIKRQAVTTGKTTKELAEYSDDLWATSQKLIDSGRYAPASNRRYQTLLNHLKRWRPTESIGLFEATDILELKDYISPGLKPASVQNYVKGLKQFYRQSCQLQGVTPKDLSRVGTVKVSDSIPEFLTIGEIKELEGMELEGPQKVARDMWITSFYLFGMRFRDVLVIKGDNFKDGQYTYRMSKNQKVLTVHVPPVIEIKEGYLFPYATEGLENDPKEWDRVSNSKNSTVARLLKKVRPGLKFHMARHSFARHAHYEKGFSVVEIKDMLRHSSLEMTDRYLAKFKASRKVF